MISYNMVQMKVITGVLFLFFVRKILSCDFIKTNGFGDLDCIYNSQNEQDTVFVSEDCYSVIEKKNGSDCFWVVLYKDLDLEVEDEALFINEECSEIDELGESWQRKENDVTVEDVDVKIVCENKKKNHDVVIIGVLCFAIFLCVCSSYCQYKGYCPQYTTTSVKESHSRCYNSETYRENSM